MANVNYLLPGLFTIPSFVLEKNKFIQVWNNSRVSTVLGELSLQSFLWHEILHIVCICKLSHASFSGVHL